MVNNLIGIIVKVKLGKERGEVSMGQKIRCVAEQYIKLHPINKIVIIIKMEIALI